MNETAETSIELGIDLSCLTCLTHLGIDPHAALFLVFFGSTFFRLMIDFLRLKIKNQTNQTDRKNNPEVNKTEIDK